MRREIAANWAFWLQRRIRKLTVTGDQWLREDLPGKSSKRTYGLTEGPQSVVLVIQSITEDIGAERAPIDFCPERIFFRIDQVH